MIFRDPFTGRAIKRDTFYGRIPAYQVQREAAADAVEYAVFRLDAAVTARQQAYWRRRLTTTRDALRQVDAGLSAMESQVYRDERERERRRQRRTRKRPLPPPPTALEWEFGTDYKSPRRGSHDVEVNVRLVFDAPVSKGMAEDVARALVRGRSVAGVTVYGVDWKRGVPRATWREGSETDFDNFRDLLYVGGVQYVRMGGVKPDEL